MRRSITDRRPHAERGRLPSRSLEVRGPRPGGIPMTIRFAHRLLVTAAFALTLGLARPLPADVVHGDRGAAIDRYLTCLSEFGISGALYVAKDGEVLVEKGYGLADRTSGARVSAASPFLLGSLSKQFTAAAILALEADGKLVV